MKDQLRAVAAKRSRVVSPDDEPSDPGAAIAWPTTLVDFIQPADEIGNVVALSPRSDLFANPYLSAIEARALAYLEAGVPVHFRGPAGTGKTTIAIQTAARLGRPAILVSGDGSFTSSHLVGREAGTKSKRTVDRYIHSVKKIETETTTVWSDDALTEAITKGYTLVYDEFTRSPPEANNPLLMAFEERMLILSGGARGERYVRAHPAFRCILTSNPEDYAGVSIPQDALIDRMITFDLAGHDRATEIGIVANRSGLAPEACGQIVDIVRASRRLPMIKQMPSMRSAIMVARIVASQQLSTSIRDRRFVQLLFDVLCSKVEPAALQSFEEQLVQIVRMLPELPSAEDQ